MIQLLIKALLCFFVLIVGIYIIRVEKHKQDQLSTILKEALSSDLDTLIDALIKDMKQKEGK